LVDKNTNYFDLNTSDQEGFNEGGGTTEVPEIAALQKSGDSSALPLHNSFDILHEDCELPQGEAMLTDKDSHHNSNDTLNESAAIMDKVSKEIVCLIHSAHSHDPVVVENGSSKSAIVDTNSTLLESDNGVPIEAPIITPVTKK